MNTETANRIAARQLPCSCGFKNKIVYEHTGDCPAHYRPAIAAALEKEAGRMPGREQIAEIIYNGNVARQSPSQISDAIIAAWSNPQADSAGPMDSVRTEPAAKKSG